MTDVLERAGYVVHALASPIGATQVIAAQRIAAAVLDLNMPVMRGDRFIALIRSWDRIRDLPIVLVSGESPSVIRQAVADMPGVSVVTKAHMGDLLVSTLAHALSGRVERDEVTETNGALHKRESLAAGSGKLSHSARAAQVVWRDYASGRVSSTQPVMSALSSLRTEVQQAGLPNTAQLLGVAGDLVSHLGNVSRLTSEAETAMSEVLAQLALPELEKVRGFERSLSLTIHRSRLERARQLLR